jgi:hypothetical protein
MNLTPLFGIAASILVVEKTRQTIVAALNNMLWDTWKIESGLAGHLGISPAADVNG